jgi:hypothetical protein
VDEATGNGNAPVDLGLNRSEIGVGLQAGLDAEAVEGLNLGLGIGGVAELMQQAQIAIVPTGDRPGLEGAKSSSVSGGICSCNQVQASIWCGRPLLYRTASESCMGCMA